MSDLSSSSGSTTPSSSRRSSTLNSFATFFQELINGFKRLFIKDNETSPSASSPIRHRNNNLEVNDEENNEEEYFEINIGNEFAQQLEEKFSDLSLPLSKGYHQPTIIELPVSLGRQLFFAYVESIYRQQDAENQIFDDIIKENEEFERELQVQLLKQEKENELTSDGEKERRFLNLVPQGQSSNDNDDEIDATYLYDVIWAEKKPQFESSYECYRSLAKDHRQKRDKFMALAKKALNSNPKMAQKYFINAKNELNFYQQANDLAAAAALVENYRKIPKSNTIYLHYLFVREALVALDIFLDKEIEALQDSNKKSRVLLIITGRGKHSINGIAKIKPEVIIRLKERGLSTFNINSGSLQTKVDRNSMLSDDYLFD